MKKCIYFAIVATCFCQCSPDFEELSIDSLLTRSVIESEEVATDYEIVSDIVTVKLKPSVRTLRSDVKTLNNNDLGYIDLSVPEGVEVEDYIAQLKESGEFESVEFNTLGEYYLFPNDLYSNEWFFEEIDLYSAWDITTGSSNIKVAVIDSGVNVTHPDLGTGLDGYGNVDQSLGWNYLAQNNSMTYIGEHGTAVAGVIAAKTNNGSLRGISGIAGGNRGRGVTIIPYCIGLDAPNSAYVDDAILDAVDKGARVINMSFGVGQNSAITSAINYALSQNVVVVCASGNDNVYGVGQAVVYPASLLDVVAVGNMGKNMNRYHDSNYGSALDVVAPGEDIMSTNVSGGYSPVGGTSIAAPVVSGIVALMLSVNPNLSAENVNDIIKETAQRIPTVESGRTIQYTPKVNGSWNNYMGHGLVNAYAAVQAAMPNQSVSGGHIFSSQTGVYDGQAVLLSYDQSPRGGNWNYAYQWQMRIYNNCA